MRLTNILIIQSTLRYTGTTGDNPAETCATNYVVAGENCPDSKHARIILCKFVPSSLPFSQKPSV